MPRKEAKTPLADLLAAHSKTTRYRRRYAKANKAKGRAEQLVVDLQRQLNGAQSRYTSLLIEKHEVEARLLEARSRSIPIGSVDGVDTLRFVPLYAEQFQCDQKLIEVRSMNGAREVFPSAMRCTIVCEGLYTVVREGERVPSKEKRVDVGKKVNVLSTTQPAVNPFVTKSDPGESEWTRLTISSASARQVECGYCHDSIYFKRGSGDVGWRHVHGDERYCREANRLFRLEAHPSVVDECPVCSEERHRVLLGKGTPNELNVLLHVVNNDGACPR